MLELVRVLGEYKNDIVLVGGWVPELLFAKAMPRHVGSTDVDLALNHRTLGDAGYQTILNHLERRGYAPGKQPFIFFRKVEVDGQTVTVQVDLLSRRVRRDREGPPEPERPGREGEEGEGL